MDDYLAARAATGRGRAPARRSQRPLAHPGDQTPFGDGCSRVRDRRPVGERETFRSAILESGLEELSRALSQGIARETSARPCRRCCGVVNDHAAKPVWRLPCAAGAMPMFGRRGVLQRPPPRTRQCILVQMGATREGQKELIAITGRESEPRGASCCWRWGAASRWSGDGGLGFWGAVRIPEDSTMNVPSCRCSPRRRRCCTTSDVDDVQRRPGVTFRPRFTRSFRRRHDRDVADHEFPAEHWIHIRSSRRRHRPAPHAQDEGRGQPPGVRRWCSSWRWPRRRPGER